MIDKTFGLGDRNLYCSQHKSANMTDLRHSKYNHINCMIIPSFGFVEEHPQYNFKHRLIWMINLPARRCNYIGCIVIPSFELVVILLHIVNPINWKA